MVFINLEDKRVGHHCLDPPPECSPVYLCFVVRLFSDVYDEEENTTSLNQSCCSQA